MSEETAGSALRVGLEEQGATVTVHVAGPVDTTTAYLLQNGLVQALESAAGLFVVDMSGVDFIDSAGLGVLVMALKRTAQRGAKLRLVVPDPRVRHLFEICGLDRVFSLYQTAAQASTEP
jgi:anti-sigma B factor antagonist